MHTDRVEGGLEPCDLSVTNWPRERQRRNNSSQSERR